MKLTSCIEEEYYLKNKINEYRIKMGMTQLDLSKEVHVTTRTIISLESGKFNPSLMLAYRIATIFNTTVEDLYCLKENKELEDKEYENAYTNLLTYGCYYADLYVCYWRIRTW